MTQSEFKYDESGFIIMKDACVNIDFIIGLEVKSNYSDDWSIYIKTVNRDFSCGLYGFRSCKKANEVMMEILSIINKHKNPKQEPIEL